jgi:hypothetical protein
MTRRLQRLALALYPLAFRRRYGGEMRALLEDSPPEPAVLPDLVMGALRAHLSPPPGLDCMVTTSERLKGSLSGVLACWVAFAAAGLAFYKTTEGVPFNTAGGERIALFGLHLAVAALAALASGAVLAGAAPLIATALGRARRDGALRRLIALPVAAVATFAALTGAISVLAQRHPGAAGGGAGLIAWILAGGGCAVVCVLTSRRVLFAIPIPRRRLGLAFIAAMLVTGAMAAIAVAVAFYAVAMVLGASHLATAENGPALISTSTWLSLTMQLTVMSASTALATITTLRAWGALGDNRTIDER